METWIQEPVQQQYHAVVVPLKEKPIPQIVNCRVCIGLHSLYTYFVTFCLALHVHLITHFATFCQACCYLMDICTCVCHSISLCT